MPQPEDPLPDTALGRKGAADAAIMVLTVLALAGAFTWLGPVLRPFLVAAFLFYGAQFGAKLLAKIGLGPRTAYTGLLAILVLLAILFGRLVQREASIFLGKWPQHEARITKAINSLPRPEHWLPQTVDIERHATNTFRNSGAPGNAEPSGAHLADTSLGDLFRRFSKTVIDYVLQHTLDVAETFVLVIVYLVFLFVGSRKLPDRIRKAFPGERGERILLLIGEGVSRSMEQFMAVKTFVGLGIATIAGLLMFAYELDHWLLWAFLFFAANYITYIGSIVACVPPIVMAFLGLPTITAAVVLSVLLIVNRFIWIDLVEIRMSGKELNLDPTVMFLWLAYWGWAWGILGLLLAYPMLAAVKIVLTHVRGGESWAALLSEE
jgi:predicted PurR-regulated permease PerM